MRQKRRQGSKINDNLKGIQRLNKRLKLVKKYTAGIDAFSKIANDPQQSAENDNKPETLSKHLNTPFQLWAKVVAQTRKRKRVIEMVDTPKEKQPPKTTKELLEVAAEGARKVFTKEEYRDYLKFIS